jgi:hypothetical protein
MKIAAERVGMLRAEVGLNAANRQIHDRQAAGGGVRFLAVDADVANAAAVFDHKLFRLHEHAAGAAARVVDTSFIR